MNEASQPWSAQDPDALSKANLLAEGRERIFAGESAERVVRFLRAMRLAETEAAVCVRRAIAERNAMIREEGIRKCRIGGYLVMAPTAYESAAAWWDFWQPLVFVPLAVAGIVGIWRLGKGLGMALKPENVGGHVFEVIP